MTKYRPYSRREFRRRFAQWATRNAGLLLAVTAGLVGTIALVTLVLTVAFTPTTFTWWFLGAFQATMVGIYLHLGHAAFLASDAEAIWHLRGAWGEENTRSELQRAKRKRLVWGWVDSISLGVGDLDHLVVTRRGGLIAVDSKWRNRASDTVNMARAADKARLRAEALAQTLLRSERGARHRAKVNPLPVTPVVVLWGAAQHGVPDGARVNDIEFVAGQRFVEWLRSRNGQTVSEDAAADVMKRLEAYRATAWDSTQTVTR
jgi:hypothetical protein